MFSYPSYAASGGFKGAKVVLPTVDTGYKSYDKGRLFLPASQNLVNNPHFVGIPATPALPAGATGSASVFDDGVAPVLKMNIVANGVLEWSTIGIDDSSWNPVAEGDVLTLSCDMWRDGDLPWTNMQMTLIVFYWNDAWGFVGNAIIPYILNPTTTRTRYSATLAPVPAGATRVSAHYFFQVWGANGEGHGYFSRPQVEKSPVATPYFEGSRAASILRFPAPAQTAPDNTMTVAGRFVRNGAIWTSETIVALNNSGAAQVSFYAGGVSLYHSDGNWPSSTIVDLTYGPTPFVARTNGKLLDLRSRGIDGVQGVIAGVPTPFSPDVLIGSDLDGAASARSYLGPLALSPYRITDAETVQLDAMLTAGAGGSDLYNWFKRKGYGGTLILPLENDSKGYIVDGGYGDNYAYTEVAASTDTGYEVYA